MKSKTFEKITKKIRKRNIFNTVFSILFLFSGILFGLFFSVVFSNIGVFYLLTALSFSFFLVFILRKDNLYNIIKEVKKRKKESWEKLINLFYFLTPEASSLYSTSLLDKYIKDTDRYFRKEDFSFILRRFRYKAFTIAFVVSGILFLIIAFKKPESYILRHIFLKKPLPLTLRIESDKRIVEKGENIRLKIEAEGDFIPRYGSLVLDYGSWKEKKRIRLQEKRVVVKIKDDCKILLKSYNIESNKLFIHLKKPFLLKKISFFLKFPSYTGIKGYRTLSKELSVLPGTHVELEGEASCILDSAHVVLPSFYKIPLKTWGKRFKGEFKIFEEGSGTIKLFSQDTLSYNFTVSLIPDEFPLVEILEPGKDIDMPSDMMMFMKVLVSDDYGVQDAGLVFIKGRDTVRKVGKKIFKKDDTLSFTIDLSSFGLLPGDEISYFAVCRDNDRVKGPKLSRTQVYRIRFPTVEEIYNQALKETYQAESEIESLKKEQEKISAELERIITKLKSEGRLSYEEKMHLEKIVKHQKKVVKSIRELKEKVEKVTKNLENNAVFDFETIKTLRELQNILEEILPQETKVRLNEILSKKEITEEDLKKLKEMKEEIKRNLKMTLEVMKRYLQEKRLEEIARKLAYLEKAEENVLKEKEIKEKERIQEKIEEGLKEIARELEEIAKELEEKEIKEEIEKLTTQIKEKGLSQSIRIRKDMKRGEISKKMLENMKKMLKEWKKKASQLAKMLKEKRSEEITQSLMKLTRELILSSEIVEEAIEEFKRGDRMDAMEKIESLRRSMRGFAERLVSLGGKSFKIPKRAIRKIFEAEKKMGQAIDEFVKGNKSTTQAMIQDAKKSIDVSAFSLLQVFNWLCSSCSGSSSGVEEWLEALNGLLSQQISISQQLSLLPLPLPLEALSPEEKRMLSEILAKQQEIREKLEQLAQEAGDMPGLTGRLDGIIEDMKRTEEDLKKQLIPREVVERQERIIRRLLDAQRSVYKSEEERGKRVREVGEEFKDLTSPTLPEGKGERNLLIKKEMIRAMQKDYPPEIRVLLKAYYESIIKK